MNFLSSVLWRLLLVVMLTTMDWTLLKSPWLTMAMVKEKLLLMRMCQVSLQPESGVATLEPYLPASGTSGVPRRKSNYTRNGNSNKNDFSRIEVLPGIFECNSYEKYLTIELDSDRKAEELDIVDVHEEIVKCCGREPKIVLQNDGSLLVETSSPEESKKLLTLKSVSGLKAKCSPHTLFNQVRGIIQSRDLLKYSEERIQEKLENQKW